MQAKRFLLLQREIFSFSRIMYLQFVLYRWQAGIFDFFVVPEGLNVKPQNN